MKLFIKIRKTLIGVITTFIVSMVIFTMPTYAELVSYPSEPNVHSELNEGNTISRTTDKIFATGVTGAKEASQKDMEYWAGIEKVIPEENSSVGGVTTFSLVNGWYELDSMSEFYYLGQETNYSCGPASVRMALRYLTGTFYNESTIRTGCKTTTNGTYLSDMISYINGQQHKNSYVARYQQSKDNMKKNLYAGVSACKAPPIIGLKESTSNSFPYNLGGHFVTIYSVRSDQTQAALADPWAGYLGDSSSRWYGISTDNLYTAYNSVNIGYMY